METQVKLLIVDTETGGVDAARQSLLQVGLVSWHNGEIQGTDEFYVREDHIIAEDQALAINHIDLEIVKREGLTPGDGCARFREFVDAHMGTPVVHEDDRGNQWTEKARLGGWNVGMDRAFLTRMFRLDYKINNIPDVAYRVFDAPTLAFALASCGKIDIPVDHVNSDTVFNYFGCAPAEHERHSAKADAIATAGVITSMLQLLTDGRP